MIVLHVSNCPQKLRGDLSKWLFEVNIGVYVGKVSGKVRDELWKRICDNVSQGQATMVYTTNNEQGFEFKVHNTTWFPVSYDGVTLMKHPLPKSKTEDEKPIEFLAPGFSKAALYQKIRHNMANIKRNDINKFVIIDVETTGLNNETDRIIEIGALKISNNNIEDMFECLINQEMVIPELIINLTGLTEEMLNENGITEAKAIKKCMEFIGNEIVFGYNVSFDIDFITKASERQGISQQIKQARDVMAIARKKIDEISDYKLDTVAKYFGFERKNKHRAIDDCKMTHQIYLKLNEMT